MNKKNGLEILLAVDGSAHSDAAVRLLTGIPWADGASVCVLAVVPERWSLTGMSPEAQSVVEATLANMHHAYRIAAEALTARTAEKLRAHNLSAITDVRVGHPDEVILQCAREWAADLIAIGAKGLSAPDEFHLGSTTHRLLEGAACSVLIARPSQRPQLVSVLLAADGSPEMWRAAELLCALGLPRWADVAVVSVAEVMVALRADEPRMVADVPEAVRRSLLAAAEARAADVIQHLHGCGAKVQAVIRSGHPAAEILAVAQERDADLLVVGARGQPRTSAIRLGGVAQRVVKYAPCSVLVVRGPAADQSST